jgi:hypothetical protein
MATDSLDWLDHNTDWDEDSGELVKNDPPPQPDRDDGAVAVLDEEDDGGLDDAETVANIVSCISDIDASGGIESIVVIVNTIGDDQLLFTTLERNDLILGTLETAKLNWYNTQCDLQSMEEEGGDE